MGRAHDGQRDRDAAPVDRLLLQRQAIGRRADRRGRARLMNLENMNMKLTDPNSASLIDLTRCLWADFQWGSATSAAQIEGAAAQDGKGRSIWDRFCEEPGRIVDGSNIEVA